MADMNGFEKIGDKLLWNHSMDSSCDVTSLKRSGNYLPGIG